MLQEFLCIAFLDNLHLFYYNIRYINLSNNARWFLLHSIINCIIIYYSFNDTLTCFLEYNTCYKIPWNINSIKTYKYAIILHLYHCVFFKLTVDDYIHHFLMVIICGTCCYLLQSIISSFSLFFLSGLPGAIDYLLLYLVKLNKIESITEKKIYVLISTYIRAPGCTYTLAIGMNGMFNYYNNSEYKNLFKLGLTLFLIYWNGQHYLIKANESYIKKLLQI